MGGVVVVQPHLPIVVQRIEIRRGGKGGSPLPVSLPHRAAVVKTFLRKKIKKIVQNLLTLAHLDPILYP
jgi:hypothetical protein